MILQGTSTYVQAMNFTEIFSSQLFGFTGDATTKFPREEVDVPCLVCQKAEEKLKVHVSVWVEYSTVIVPSLS